MTKQNKSQGFTLIEVLLVMVIVGIMIFAGVNYVQQRALQMRIDRTSLQMQQILNAGLSYYVSHGQWPVTGPSSSDLSALSGYLPPAMTSPWGNDYFISTNTDKTNFFVYTSVNTVSSGAAAGIAKTIAGTLPLSYTQASTPNPDTATGACPNKNNLCYVVSSVNIPGQNLNNATAINFAGIYHHGACVPVPTCPVANMSPQIIVSPVQVSGNYDGDTPAGSPKTYPISSFSAYAKGGPGVVNPQECTGSGTTDCGSIGGAAAPNGYWRVCIQVVTERGEIDATTSDWARYQTMMAVTRCSINNEPRGSTFNVWKNS